MSGNQQQQPIGCNLEEGIRGSIGVCGWLAYAEQMFVRTPGQSGARNWGLAALSTAALPLLIGEFAPKQPFHARDPLYLYASGVMLFAFFVQRGRSQENAGKIHSHYIGHTIGADRPVAWLELLYGLILAFLLGYIAAPLSTLMLFSTVANQVFLASIRTREKLEVINAHDQAQAGRYFAERMEAYRK